MPAAVHHWPLVKHDGRAEAALIAVYGLRLAGGIGPQRSRPARIWEAIDYRAAYHL
jgi:hypothetical protein